MKKYYKVDIHSENIDIDKYNPSIIAERGFIYAKEIATNTRIMICDNIAQGCMHDYYVLSEDFNSDNIVRYDELKEYLENFSLTNFPIYSNPESRKAKRLVKRYNKRS